MTNDDKLNMLKRGIAPDADTDEVLNDALSSAGALILTKMYPFGYPDGTVVPTRYENIQVQLAIELYSKRGAEGQISHSENGINRSWPEKSALLARIVPQCGSVM